MPIKNFNPERLSKKNVFKQYELAYLYHENTKFDRLKSLDDFNHIGQIRMTRDLIIEAMYHYKEYIDAKIIKLPEVKTNTELSFEEVLMSRRSIREFSKNPIPLSSMAKLLFLSYGITGEMKYDNDEILHLRAAPSGGALYPLEIYIAAFNIESLQKGLYHYNVKKHLLEAIKEGDFQEKLYNMCIEQEVLNKCGGLIVISAIMERTLFKYRNRGLRFIYMDAGHLAQNIYLVATAEKLGACALGGFYDYEMDELIGVDGFYESSIYSIALGTRVDWELNNADKKADENTF